MYCQIILKCATHKRLYSLRATQSRISLRICAGWSAPSLPAFRINGYCSVCWRTENAKIRLHGCECWSGPLLFAFDIRAIFPRCASFSTDSLVESLKLFCDILFNALYVLWQGYTFRGDYSITIVCFPLEKESALNVCSYVKKSPWSSCVRVWVRAGIRWFIPILRHTCIFVELCSETALTRWHGVDTLFYGVYIHFQ